MVAEWLHKGKPTALGFASGLVAGSGRHHAGVGLRPADARDGHRVNRRRRLLRHGVLEAALGYDDSLDAFGVHGVGGFLGAVLTGVFASSWLFATATGASSPPAISTVGHSMMANGGKSEFSSLPRPSLPSSRSVLTLVLVKVIDMVFGFTLDAKAENEGTGPQRTRRSRLRPGPGPGAVAGPTGAEPRPATVPPNGKRRFTIVVEGPSRGYC